MKQQSNLFWAELWMMQIKEEYSLLIIHLTLVSDRYSVSADTQRDPKVLYWKLQ